MSVDQIVTLTVALLNLITAAFKFLPSRGSKEKSLAF